MRNSLTGAWTLDSLKSFGESSAFRASSGRGAQNVTAGATSSLAREAARAPPRGYDDERMRDWKQCRDHCDEPVVNQRHASRPGCREPAAGCQQVAGFVKHRLDPFLTVGCDDGFDPYRGASRTTALPVKQVIRA